MATRKQTSALAYYRTSSAANVDGDSLARQRIAVQRFAAANGIEIADQFYDAAISGADAVESRPGFLDMLTRAETTGVRLLIVEDASRFARSVIAQELGILMLTKLGVRVLTASGVSAGWILLGKGG